MCVADWDFSKGLLKEKQSAKIRKQKNREDAR